MQNLADSWARAWADLGVQPPAGLYEQLIEAYREPQRHYHSLQHLTECMAHFDQARHHATHPGEVALALWFHDAIYEVKGAANEQRSADWAVSVLRAAGAAPATQERVHQLIMATKHDAVVTDPDQQLLVDIDLAILGASPERFAEYDRQVRAEYSWVPSLLYRVKRKAVLRSFLARDPLYSTPHFRQHLEDRARRNLASVT